MNAVGRFLPFPLAHSGEDRKEETPARGAGVNALVEGNHVAAKQPELIGQFEEFTRVAGQPGEFGEDEAGDVAAFEVGQHFFGEWMLLDGLAAPALQPGKIIHLDYLPALGDSIRPCPGFVDFGRISFGLVLGGNTNPDANAFAVLIYGNEMISLHGRVLLSITSSSQK